MVNHYLPTFQGLPKLACVCPGILVARGRIWEEWGCSTLENWKFPKHCDFYCWDMWMVTSFPFLWYILLEKRFQYHVDLLIFQMSDFSSVTSSSCYLQKPKMIPVKKGTLLETNTAVTLYLKLPLLPLVASYLGVNYFKKLLNSHAVVPICLPRGFWALAPLMFWTR